MDKLIVENLNKRVNSFTLYGATFKVHAGEIFALVGMTGSGKSTVTKIIHNLTYADSGEINFDKTSIGALIQDHELYKRKTVYKTMIMFARMYVRDINRAEIRNTLRAVGLYKKRGVKVKDLTNNRYTRLKIALAIISRPAILVLDEPFAYLGDIESREIRVILKTLAERFDTAILLTASDFEGIEEIFDTVAIIDSGEIICVESYNNLAQKFDKFAKICISTTAPNLVATEITDKFGYKTNLHGEDEVIITAHPDKAQEIADHLESKGLDIKNTMRVHRSIAPLFHSMRTRNYDADGDAT